QDPATIRPSYTTRWGAPRGCARRIVVLALCCGGVPLANAGSSWWLCWYLPMGRKPVNEAVFGDERALSSGVERCLDAAEARGSNPLGPTMRIPSVTWIRIFLWTTLLVGL